MITLTKRYAFSASHRLHSPSLSDEENEQVFGKCNNPYGHGHNYFLEVSVRGPVDGQTGQAVHLPTLDRLVTSEVLSSLDHRSLNHDVVEFQGDLVPTTENLGLVIEDRLRRGWPSAFPNEWPKLEKIRIEETSNNIFEVRGSDTKIRP